MQGDAAMTAREQYHAMLDELDAESKLRLIDHVPFAKLLEEVDPIAYRCGANDFQPTCKQCRQEYWADDPDDDAYCDTCREEMRAAELVEEADVEENADGELCPDCGSASPWRCGCNDEEKGE